MFQLTTGQGPKSCIFKKLNFSWTSYFSVPFNPKENTTVRACEQLQKFCEHEQASTCVFFASKSSKGQILRALLNRMGPFDTPIVELASSINLPLTKVHSLLLELEIKTNKTYKSMSKLGCHENLRPQDSSLCSYHGLFYGHAMFIGNSQKEARYLSSPVFRCPVYR